MLTHRRLPARLSVFSLDLPVRSTCETTVTLYQRAPQRFHLLIDVSDANFSPPDRLAAPSLNAPPAAPPGSRTDAPPEIRFTSAIEAQSHLLWLEISQTRAIFTAQSRSKTGLSYRHMWERGTYGISRYWLNTMSAPLPESTSPESTSPESTSPESTPSSEQGDGSLMHRMRLRNFTRDFQITGKLYPQHVRVEYELWSQQLKLGTYVLDLDLQD